MSKYIVYTKEKGKIETNKRDDFEYLTWHIEDGPAFQIFHDNRQLFHEEYYINGKRHRIDGPAYQRFYDTGQLYYESYYINGRFYIKSDYAVYMFNKKMQLL